jgi:hypothetical protein
MEKQEERQDTSTEGHGEEVQRKYVTPKIKAKMQKTRIYKIPLRQ